jgi:hypothetical protein
MSLRTVNTNITKEYTVTSSSCLPLRWGNIFLGNVDTHITGYYTDLIAKVSFYNLAFTETGFVATHILYTWRFKPLQDMYFKLNSSCSYSKLNF